MIGTIEFEKALEKISSTDTKRIAEGIGIALAIEKESLDFYSAKAKSFSERQTSDFFVFLAGQEKQHFEAISRLKESLEKKGKFLEPELLSVEKTVFFAKKDWDRTEKSESISIILFALWKEKQAKEFYLGIAEKAKSGQVKDFFSSLAVFEQTHAELLESYLENSFYTRELIMG